MSGMTLLRATRPKFLLLALMCAALGIVMTGRQLTDMPGAQLTLVVLGSVLAHAAVNLLNEYQDFRSGLDLLTQRTPFSGGSGALPENPEAAPRVLVAFLVSIALVVLIGLYFLWLRGLPIVVLGAAGLLLVIGYTRWITRSPWLCLLAPGLGFGPIMILGTQLALGGRSDTATVVVALVVMLGVSMMPPDMVRRLGVMGFAVSMLALMLLQHARRAARISAKASAVETWAKCTAPPVIRASRMSRQTIIASVVVGPKPLIRDTAASLTSNALTIP